MPDYLITTEESPTTVCIHVKDAVFTAVKSLIITYKQKVKKKPNIRTSLIITLQVNYMYRSGGSSHYVYNTCKSGGWEEEKEKDR